jgi:hypothetical protein
MNSTGKWLVVLFSAMAATLGGAASAATPSPLEPVRVSYAAPLPNGGITLKVTAASGGCTSAAHFKLQVTQEPSRQLLRVVRLQKDFCERFDPQGTTVELSSPDLSQGKPIYVENPLFVGMRP